VKADRTQNALYMRGTDPAHHIHVLWFNRNGH
jgi:hypothetical protein